jgi:hypothetical protein
VLLSPGELAPGARLLQEWYIVGKHQFAKYVSPLSFLTLTYMHAPTHMFGYKAMYTSYFIFHDTGEDEVHSVIHYEGPDGE